MLVDCYLQVLLVEEFPDGAYTHFDVEDFNQDGYPDVVFYHASSVPINGENFEVREMRVGHAMSLEGCGYRENRQNTTSITFWAGTRGLLFLVCARELHLWTSLTIEALPLISS